jgi:hypothetical protein
VFSILPLIKLRRTGHRRRACPETPRFQGLELASRTRPLHEARGFIKAYEKKQREGFCGLERVLGKWGLDCFS